MSKMPDGAFGKEAIEQILRECAGGIRTLDPAFEIATGLHDKGYAIVPREPTRAMYGVWEDMEPEDILETELDGLWAQLIAASHVPQ